MAYKALYNTYRPTTFDEVAGQQHIVRTIKNAFSTNKIAHAYLFAGPRGTGKTTMARLLAKALNCEDGQGCQCNECKNCKAINEGTHPDVIEIDAASNNGVNEIREVIDKVRYGTMLGRYTVYIIDEVHMLSTGAFNALLKTLEEPPEHVIFILATTEPHKVLPTIISRCQRFDFTKVSEEDIKERLRTVLQQENIPFNEEAIELIISLCDGGMRDALSILDQVLAYSGNSLNTQDILDIFALESVDEKLSLLSSIQEGNVSDILSRLNKYVLKGTDIKRLTNDLLVILKDILIYKTSKTTEFCEMLKDENLSYFADRLTEAKVMEMIDALMSALKDYRNVSSINPLFEITLLKLASISSTKEEIVHKETPIFEQPKPIEKVVKKEEPTMMELVNQVSEQPTIFEASKPAPVVLNKDVLILKEAEKDDNFVISDELLVKIMVAAKKDIKNQMLDNWKKIKQLLTHPELGKAAAMLVDAHVLVASSKILILEHQSEKLVEDINTKANQHDIQNVITSAFGEKMFVYALSRNQSVASQQRYINLKQIGSLPKIDDINFEFIGD